MSNFVPIRIPEDERVRREQNLFETHRHRQLATYYPESSLCDASQEEVISCWSDPPLILKKLRDILPFGHVTASWDFNDFQDQVLDKVSDASQEQLLYWHLSAAATLNNYPAETALLWTKDDYLWFIHIPPRRQEYIRRILAGERLRYLERFHLNYDQIQVNFQELRLVTRPGTQDQYDLVITEGVEFTYKWDSSFWETSLQNHSRFIDPEVFHQPPDTPDDPEIIEFADAIRIRNDEIRQSWLEPPPLEEGSLPPSSPPSIPTASVSGWGDTANQWPTYQHCWCRKEVCDCNYRPDTPPTPPSVVLWAPGSSHLPFRE